MKGLVYLGNNKIELTEKILKNYKNNENLILLLNLFRG